MQWKTALCVELQGSNFIESFCNAINQKAEKRNLLNPDMKSEGLILPQYVL